jgi:hypothetical protein
MRLARLPQLKKKDHIWYPTIFRFLGDFGSGRGVEGGPFDSSNLPNKSLNLNLGGGATIWLDPAKFDDQTLCTQIRQHTTRIDRDPSLPTAVAFIQIEPITWKTLLPKSQSLLHALVRLGIELNIPLVLDETLTSPGLYSGFSLFPFETMFPSWTTCVQSKLRSKNQNPPSNIFVCFGKGFLQAGLLISTAAREMYLPGDFFKQVADTQTVYATAHTVLLSAKLLVWISQKHWLHNVLKLHQSIPKTLKQFGLPLPEAGHGCLWRFSTAQMKHMKKFHPKFHSMLDFNHRMRVAMDLTPTGFMQALKWKLQH